MVNNILDGISLTLKECFPDFEIYIEKVPQGFQEPCFLLRVINDEREKQIGNFHFFSYQFSIRYHSDKVDKNEDCYAMSDKLYNLLHFLEKRKLRGKNLNSRVQDDVLHFFVTYQMRVKKSVESVSMEDLEIRSDLKDG